MGNLRRALPPLPLPAAATLLLLAAGGLEAQGIRASVDRTEITIEDPLTLTVTVEGSQEARPELPPLPHFQVQPRGQSSQVQIVNGRMSASVSYHYRLIPLRTGTVTIGPASVEIDGRTFRSQPFTVRILEASAQPRQSRDLFVTATVSDSEPYLGQQTIFTWRFYRRIRVADPRLGGLEFPGFAVESLGEVRELQATVDGQVYLVSEIKKALFPQEEGRLTIPGPVLTCGVPVRRPGRRDGLFDDLFGRVQTEDHVLHTEPVEVRVRPLPAPPPAFSGLVGRFDVRSEVSKRELQVGESTTFKVTVSGTGNARMIGEPELPELAAFKVYDDKPAGSVETTEAGVRGHKSFSKALVPLTPGELELPALTLTYFDPEAGSYRTATAAPIRLSVSPADGEEELRLTESVAPTTGKVAVKILADDILPLHKGLDAVASQPPRGSRRLLWWGGLALPPLAFLGVFAAQRRRERFARDRGLRRRREGLRRARGLLRQVEAEVRSGNQPGACRLASRCLRGLVGDKLDLEGTALTPEETAAHLQREGLAPATVERTRQLLERLEAAQYGTGGAQAGDCGRLAAELDPLLRQLDREIP